MNPQRRIPREVGSVQRTIYPAEYTRIDRNSFVALIDLMTKESHATLEDALVHEVWRQDLSAVQRLLESGANPNLPGRKWSSAIACAGECDEIGDIVRALVAAGADINTQDA